MYFGFVSKVMLMLSLFAFLCWGGSEFVCVYVLVGYVCMYVELHCVCIFVCWVFCFLWKYVFWVYFVRFPDIVFVCTLKECVCLHPCVKGLCLCVCQVVLCLLEIWSFLLICLLGWLGLFMFCVFILYVEGRLFRFVCVYVRGLCLCLWQVVLCFYVYVLRYNFFLFWTIRAFYGNLWAIGDHLSESPPTWVPLPWVNSQSPLRPWPGFEPMHSRIPRSSCLGFLCACWDMNCVVKVYFFVR